MLVRCREMSSDAQKYEPQMWLVATVPSCCRGERREGCGVRRGSLVPGVQGRLGTLVHTQPVCCPSPFGLIWLLAGLQLIIKNNLKGRRKHFIICLEPCKAQGVIASFTCSLFCSESSFARWNISPA